MNIREMTAADIPSAREIDINSFSYPWSEQFFVDELKKDYSRYFVMETDGEILGYVGIWCIYETAELIRIATAPKHLRKGVGSSLMKKIFECSAECGCERMMLEVRASNIGARKLYEKYGFNEISVRKGYYNGEDAIIMEVAIK